jgi:4-amino-4-deoxy-L-arabinose transferase-like glycosyltransferase
MLLLAAYLFYAGLGTYHDSYESYDSGVYLESARLMGRGFKPYGQIFCSQPPLWLSLIYASFRLFGESFLAGQLVTATSGLIAIVAVMLMTNTLGGRGAAILAGALIIFSSLWLEWSRLINADVPCVALAAMGIALACRYARDGRRGWLVAASVAMVCAILIKLLAIYAVPSLLLFVLARGKHAQVINRRERFRLIATDLLIIVGVFTSITLATLSLYRFDQVWDQAVAFHWKAREAYPAVSFYEQISILYHLLVGERLLMIGAYLAPLCLISGSEGFALFAWPFFTFLGLLDHRPLFDHHVVALVPALAASIGVGAANLWILNARSIRWLWVQPRPILIVVGAIYVAGGLMALREGANRVWVQLAEQQAFIKGSAVPSPDVRIAELIIKHIRPNDMIITDAQGIAFLAGRDVPPELADTSHTRITAGYLRPSDVIAQGARYHIRLVLLWTGRLSSMPEVLSWAEKQFPQRVDFGDGRVLYLSELE